MTLGEHVFLYCERGTSDALLAEPINAASNGAFLLAALAGLALVLLRPREKRSADHYLLIGLVLLIGLGSFAFHLYATTGTELADVLPISIFMLVYLGFALNRFLGVPVGWSTLLVIGFTALMAANMQVKCWEGGIGMPGPEAQGVKSCLNGSLFYLPALGVLIVVGFLLEERRHRAAPYLLWGAAILTISVTLRSLDMALCDKILIEGRNVGTHFVWHILNALALFLLLRASLEDSPDAVRAMVADSIESAPPSQTRDEAAGDAGGEASVHPQALSERIASAEGAAQEETAPEDAEGSEEGEDKTLLPA